MKYRYTVLTYDIGNYEILREIGEKDPEAEYIWVTDDKNQTSDTWTVVYDESLEGMHPLDKCYTIRFNAFRYCHSDICLRIDSSICIKKSLKPLIDIFEEGKYDMALMPHPIRDNFIEEYNVWVEGRGYAPKQAERWINDLKEKGYDFGYKGMFQLCFWIQRRNQETLELNSKTLEYMRELGVDGVADRIDQVAFSYLMNTYHSHLKILPVSEQIVRSCYMQWFEHKSYTPNLNMFYDYSCDDERYMFNKKVKCLYLDTPSDKVHAREQELQTELKDVWQTNKEKDIIIAHTEAALHKSEIHVETLKNTISGLQSHIAAQQSNIEQQTRCVGEQQKCIEILQGCVDSISKKNKKHLSQIRTLIIICFITFLGLILSLIL